MTDVTPRLSLPLILPAQAQKHVTHNEALRLLDTVAQLVLEGIDATAPPETAAEGAVWALGPAPSGAWEGERGKLALRVETGWMFLSPQEGWQGWDRQTQSLRVWSAGAWQRPALDHLPGLGIGTAHDATNRLAVVAPATLLTHAGGGHQVKVNKAAAGDTASLLFQTGWSGRAEMGLAGDEDFALKVSADGATWTEAMKVRGDDGQVSLGAGLALPSGTAAAPALSFAEDADTGLVRTGADHLGLACGGMVRLEVRPAEIRLNLPVTGPAVTQSPADPTAGRLLKVGDFGLGTTGQAPPCPDLEALDLPAGLFAVSEATPNLAARPTGAGSPALVQVLRLDTATLWQIYLDRAGAEGAPRLWLRGRAGALGWGPWELLLTSRSIVGPVSQSDGIATGAVVERGSTATGAFLRHADGTQICWHDLPAVTTTSADGAVFDNGADLHWAFPAPFAGVPVVGPGRGGSVQRWVAVGAVDEQGAVHRVKSTASDPTPLGYGLMAVGRWF